MYELTGKISGVSIDYLTGKPMVTLTLNEVEPAREMIDALKGQDKLTIKIGKFRKKRSHDANAYFHALVNKIAPKVGMSDDEAKRWLVKRYGTLAKDENGDLIGAMLPASVDVDKFYPYTRDYKTEWRDGKEYTCYLFYERTRDLDTAQMSHLIQGTVDEAKCLGIEVKPEAEINSLLAQWR